MSMTMQGVAISDSKLAREITELVRDAASPLLFQQLLQRDPSIGLAGVIFGDHYSN